MSGSVLGFLLFEVQHFLKSFCLVAEFLIPYQYGWAMGKRVTMLDQDEGKVLQFSLHKSKQLIT